MGNRKQPFGYRMTLGEITIQPEEAELVRFIFQGYSTGTTLGELTKALCRQEIPYYEGRSWNKNMVSRILEDERYIGEKGYPALIEPEQLRAAAEKRSARACPPQKTPAQKALRRLCGAPPSAQTERIVTELLNELIRCPDRVQPAASKVVGTACGKTREELTSALERHRRGQRQSVAPSTGGRAVRRHREHGIRNRAAAAAAHRPQARDRAGCGSAAKRGVKGACDKQLRDRDAEERTGHREER